MAEIKGESKKIEKGWWKRVGKINNQIRRKREPYRKRILQPRGTNTRIIKTGIQFITCHSASGR